MRHAAIRNRSSRRTAVMGAFPAIPPGCASDHLTAVSSVVVAAPDHALAKIKGTVSRAALSKHVQRRSPTVRR